MSAPERAWMDEVTGVDTRYHQVAVAATHRPVGCGRFVMGDGTVRPYATYLQRQAVVGITRSRREGVGTRRQVGDGACRLVSQPYALPVEGVSVWQRDGQLAVSVVR